jgi:hypothetical protein
MYSLISRFKWRSLSTMTSLSKFLLRPYENQRTLPSIPEPPQHHPEQFVRDSKPWLWVPPFQNSELLPENQIFQELLAARAKEPDSQNREKPEQTEHEPVSHGDWQRKARNSSD